jgi:prepilin-type N-terminal cleavage/methylation domain-containing protein
MISRTDRRGFTLVEILMVLAIIGITTLVTMPYLVQSIRGNRLRVAAQTVVKAGYYARTMALLRNTEMTLTLDPAAHSVRVEPRYAAAPPPPGDPAPEPATPSAGDEPVGEPSPTVPTRIAVTRKLDAVAIVSVEVGDPNKTADGTATVYYRSNGRCTPYEVRLRDDFGSVMVITVDAISNAKARKEGG